ncbi:MAG: hypothetical protein GC145_18515 [Caulobacter sp.]|nr:hypothetical protein [Caulobacter sp.]
MHRIDAADATVDDLFKKTPAPATPVTPEWLNDVQENICGVVEAAGIDLDKGDYTQLLEAIRRIGGGAAGNVAMHAGSTAPDGWLECDGAAVSRADYSVLFAVIGTTYGGGDGSTTFNLPDMRGEFARGWDHGRGVDTGRALGSTQAQAIQAHTHGLPNLNTGSGPNNSINNSGGAGAAQVTGSTGGTETRPRNVALMYIIQAF